MDIVDYTNEYSGLVSFSLNKSIERHRWYPFVEGFSREFVKSILAEQKAKPSLCLDPFGGIGTTALACQEYNVNCISFESNPLFSDFTKVKLREDYDSEIFERYVWNLKEYFKHNCRAVRKFPILESKTFFQNDSLDRWIFDKSVAYGILDISSFIGRIEGENEKYASLFRLALGSILVEVSNVYRNGKCMSYKKNWRELSNSRKDVHKLFLYKCERMILPDLRISSYKSSWVNNYNLHANGDSRKLIYELDDNSVDLVITSPPYLNSRDYTDIYRLELWMLNYINEFEQEQIIRKRALTSHVQLTLEEFDEIENIRLKEFLKYINSKDVKLWNKSIPNMIKGYFKDMKALIEQIFLKTSKKGRVYINVSNSAYAGRIIEVDFILAEIAEKSGFKCQEIRVARMIGSSKQQNLSSKLRESVIVLEK